MKGRFLLPPSNEAIMEHNIYADKSSLVLEWLLLTGIEKEQFSLREVAQAIGLGTGSVHRVFEVLILKGLLQSIGLRTNKRFLINNPVKLLNDWVEHYNLVKKCKMWTYSTGFQNRAQVVEALIQSKLYPRTVLALHSAADALGCKNTNLQQLELYFMQSNMRPHLEKALKLHPKERGYEVLLIGPYYKSMLNRSLTDQQRTSKKQLVHAPALLTFLDLSHFPLRGIEQAEFMAERLVELKKIYKKKG
jgi:hypothetical protein